MCGIVYTLRMDKKPAKKMVAKRYQKQKHRGSQGFGYVSVKGDRIQDYVKATTEKKILELLDSSESSHLLFHHRYPTSTENFSETAHPIKVSLPTSKYDYYVVHNGVISNDDELKEKHDKEGILYGTEIVQKWRSKNHNHVISKMTQYNDSECLAIELAKYFDGEGSKDGIPQVRGSIAFIAYKVDRASKKILRVFFARNSGNPLNLEYAKGKHLVLSSEGNGSPILTDTLYCLHLDKVYTDETKCIENIPFKCGTYGVPVTTYNYGDYENFQERTIGFRTPAKYPEGYDADDEDDTEDIIQYALNYEDERVQEEEQECFDSIMDYYVTNTNLPDSFDYDDLRILQKHLEREEMNLEEIVMTEDSEDAEIQEECMELEQHVNTIKEAIVEAHKKLKNQVTK